MDDVKGLLKYKDQTWLHATLSSLGDALLTGDLSGLIDYANTEALRILDLPLNKIIGKHLDSVLRIRRKGSSEEWGMWTYFDENHREQDSSLPNHAYYTKPNGEWCYLSAHLSTIKSADGLAMGFVIVFREITQIVKTEDLVAWERNNLKTMFELLPIGMAVINDKVNVTRVNQAFLSIFSLNESQVLNKPFGDVVVCVNSQEFGCGNSKNCTFCKFRKKVLEFIKENRTFKDYLLELQFFRDGEIKHKWLNISFMPVRSDYIFEYILTLDDVTERIRYENSLNEARKSSLDILNSLPVMIYRMDRNHACDFINQTFKTYMNITQESFLEALEKHMHQNDYQYYIETVNGAIQEESVFSLELDVMSPYGIYRTFIGQGSPYYNETGVFQGILGVFLDIHDARMAEYLYRQSQNKYFSLFKNMKNSISYHHIERNEAGEIYDTTIVEMNDAAYHDFKIASHQVVGRKLSNLDFISPNEVVLLLERFKQVLESGESFHINDYYLEKMQRWIEISIYSPETDYMALLITDIDFKKRAEIDLKDAIERSEQANRAKSTFLANMSHEIRTPLNGIVGMIDLTMQAHLNKEQQDNLKTAKGCVHSLIDIINDVLDFAKIEAGKVRIEQQGFDLVQSIDEIVKTHSLHAIEKGLVLKINYEDISARHLIGDIKRLKQILNNLISNAIKFTNSGDVTVVVCEQESLMSAENVFLKISVIDTGIGISPDQYSLLFKSFSQVDGTYTRQYGGTGLGLVITKQLTEMMDGTINFESELGKGSTFTVELPMLKTTEVEMNNFKQQDNYTFKNASVLVVEDDRVNQIVISKMLESCGIQVEMATNGLEAARMSELKTYDLIIMDIQMPKVDGVQVTQYIRGKIDLGINPLGEETNRTYLNKTTPIIALTAFAMKGDEAIFRGSGMDDYLSKPVDLTQLQEVLKKHIKDHDSQEWKLINDLVSSYNKPKTDRLQTEVENVSEPIKIVEISKKLEQLKLIQEDNDSGMMEVLAHQLKNLFEEAGIEELKSMTFKMELEIRKEHYDRVLELLNQIESIWLSIDSNV